MSGESSICSDSPDLLQNEEWTVVNSHLLTTDEADKPKTDLNEPDFKDNKNEDDSPKQGEVTEKVQEIKPEFCYADPMSPDEQEKQKDDGEEKLSGDRISAEFDVKENKVEKLERRETAEEKLCPTPEGRSEASGDPLGVARVEDIRDDMSDISSVTDVLSTETAVSPSTTFLHYFNVASDRINLLLTVMAVLVVTAMLGLGIVSLVGQSPMDDIEIPQMPSKGQQERQEMYHSHHHHQKREHREYPLDNDLLKLARYLHRQLTMCSKHPNHKACLKDGEKWHNQFADLISGENGPRILRELDVDAPLPDTRTPANTQKLQELEEKLGLLAKQIENLQVQKDREEVQKINSQTRTDFEKETGRSTEKSQSVDRSFYDALNEQVQLLKLQNQELHAMMQTFKNKDAVASDIKTELWKLKDEVAHAIHDNSKPKFVADKMSGKAGINTIRQQINDLQMENHDLRKEIGRLRYSQSQQHESKPQLQPQARMVQEAPPKVSDGLFGKWPEINWTQLVIHLGRTPQGRQLEELGVALSQLLRDLWELNSTLFPSEDASQEDSQTQDSLKEIEKLLVLKWNELQETVSSSHGYVSRQTERMGNLLAATMRNIYKTGIRALFGEPNNAAPTVTSAQPQLQNALSKMGQEMTSLEEKWKKIKDDAGNRDMEIVDGMEEELDEVEDDEDLASVPHWVSQKPKHYREPAVSKQYEDWHTQSWKNKKHDKREHDKWENAKHPSCKDPKKCKKNHHKQNSKDDNYVWKADLPKQAYKESRGY